MAVTGRVHSRGIVRLLVLCAVLLGLFLMHGAPATAAEGCHGTMSAAPMPAGHDAAVAASGHSVPMAHPGGNQQAGASPTAHGAMCVSTPARDRTQLPIGGMASVVAVLTAISLAGRPRILGRTGRRGPPPTPGRSLLLQVCIART